MDELDNRLEPLSLTVVTPSYFLDKDLCFDLNRSILRNSNSSVDHKIIVPRKDFSHFTPLENDRTSIHDVQDFLPNSMRPVPTRNIWVNFRRPFPPVRGWIAQQIVKIGVVAGLETDLVLLADSDLLFIRKIDPQLFAPSGELQLYRRPDAIDDSLPRHRIWHDVARKLLGLGSTPPGRLVDYVCWPCVWSPAIARQMIARIEKVMNVPWQTAVGSQLHFSEMILYGLFVDEILGKNSKTSSTDNMRCLRYYDEQPLTGTELRDFLGDIEDTDIAVMVSAKSRTDLNDRRLAFEEYMDSIVGDGR